MSDPIFDSVYKARTEAETRDLYDAWSATYEKAMEDGGYATPGRCAQALRAAMDDPGVPLLDFGCGTGLSGLALRLAGFQVIDGVDLSPGMLDLARDKAIYRHLSAIGPDDPVPEGYAAIAAIGVIGIGAAPLETLKKLFSSMESGSKCVFSLNDLTLEDPTFEGLVDQVIGDGTFRQLSSEHGTHLPGKDIKSTVYVLEKN